MLIASAKAGAKTVADNHSPPGCVLNQPSKLDKRGLGLPFPPAAERPEELN